MNVNPEILNQPARTVELTALDFETTGSVPGWPVEPWQIGWVTIRNGCLDPESLRVHLIRVGDRPFSRHAPGRHRLLRRELLAAPDFASLWPTLKPHLQVPSLVAHQAATERNVLRRLAPLHVPGRWIDTLRLVRHAYPGLASGALEDVLKALKLESRAQAVCPGRPFHDALFDAVGCAVILEHLLAQPAWRSPSVHQLTTI